MNLGRLLKIKRKIEIKDYIDIEETIPLSEIRDIFFWCLEEVGIKRGDIESTYGLDMFNDEYSYLDGKINDILDGALKRHFKRAKIIGKMRVGSREKNVNVAVDFKVYYKIKPLKIRKIRLRLSKPGSTKKYKTVLRFRDNHTIKRMLMEISLLRKEEK